MSTIDPFSAHTVLPDQREMGGGMLRYRRIRELLLKRIVDGKLRRGDPMPSEGQIAKQFGVSLGTVRRAVDELVARNVLERRQGKGMFVAAQDSATTLRLLFHISDEKGAKELPAFHRLLSVRTRPASGAEAQLLNLRTRAQVVEMRRTRSFSDGALMAERVVLPGELFPNFAVSLGDVRPKILYDFYEKTFGVSVMDIEERIRAVLATKTDAALIGCMPGSPLLKVERRAYGYDDKPVELRITLCETRKRYYLRSRL